MLHEASDLKPNNGPIGIFLFISHVGLMATSTSLMNLQPRSLDNNGFKLKVFNFLIKVIYNGSGPILTIWLFDLITFKL